MDAAGIGWADAQRTAGVVELPRMPFAGDQHVWCSCALRGAMKKMEGEV